jgi:hypothetical protein
VRQNDPKISTLNLSKLHSILPTNYATPLAKALEGNTQISAVTLTDCVLDCAETELSRSEPLFQYICTSDSIRQIVVWVEDKRLLAELLISVGNNPSIEELTLQRAVPSTAFRDLMATTRSLKTLALRLYPHSRDEMTQAFTVNQTLQNVQLTGNGDRGVDCIGSVLRGITLSGTKTLQVLELDFGNWGTMKALCQLLGTVDSLRHLKLNHMDFNTETMRAFVGCLRKPTNSDVPCSSITKLTLSFCSGVDGQFIDLLQSKTIQWIDTTSWSSPLVELSVRHYKDNSINQIASILHGSLEKVRNEGNQRVQLHWCPTIASQLTSLHIHPLLPDTLQLFALHARHIRLERLYLSSEAETDCNELANVIPYMPALRALHIATTYDSNDTSQILLGVFRQSGNLHAASICQKSYTGINLCFHPDSVRRTNAYCERNRQMDLSVPNGTACWTLAESNGVPPLFMNHVDNALYPLLLTVAKQVPISHHCSRLSLLLRLG